MDLGCARKGNLLLRWFFPLHTDKDHGRVRGVHDELIGLAAIGFHDKELHAVIRIDTSA